MKSDGACVPIDPKQFHLIPSSSVPGSCGDTIPDDSAAYTDEIMEIPPFQCMRLLGFGIIRVHIEREDKLLHDPTMVTLTRRRLGPS
jgi:hypothetical protein